MTRASRPRKPRSRGEIPDPDHWSPCARCGEPYKTAANWPEGPICTYCYQAARRRLGVCADCGHNGLVPGINSAGEPTCLRCSGLPLDQTCTGCGEETWLAKGRTCWRCLLDTMVRELLAGPDGSVDTALEPLAVAIASMPRPNSGVTWIRANPKVGDLLAALGAGWIELSHEALDGLPAGRSVEFIRGLLVANKVLPPRDRRIATYESWLADKLEAIHDEEHRRLIERFGRWHHLRNLRELTKNGPVEAGPFLRAKQSTTVAIQFLSWLADRGRTLAECTQHDIDAWYASGTATRQHVERFLYWSRSHRLTTKLALPRRNRDNQDILGEHHRLKIIRSLLLHDELPAAYRVAGCLVTLFGQSVSRIITLTIEDTRTVDGRVQIVLADDWLDLPEQLAIILEYHLENQPNTQTAANTESKWLFPGTMPSQHIDRETMLTTLHAAGIPVRASRNTTWQQMVREAPPQVLARALGISPKTAMQHAERAGADWTQYAAFRARPIEPR